MAERKSEAKCFHVCFRYTVTVRDSIVNINLPIHGFVSPAFPVHFMCHA